MTMVDQQQQQQTDGGVAQVHGYEDSIHRDTIADVSLDVDREFDWSHRIPGSEVPDYFEVGNEYQLIKQEVLDRHEFNSPCRIWLTGHTGTAKTTLAKNVARDFDAPLFTVQGEYALDEDVLVGLLSPTADGMSFIYGPVPKALLASTDGMAVLLVDEIDRVHPKSKGSLFPVLDDRCEVEVRQLGSEVITGDLLDLVVFCTTNEGAQYVSSDEMGMAERSRFTSKHEIEYLGVQHPEREVDLLTDRTSAGEQLAGAFVSCANKMRMNARTPTSNISIGLPTRALLAWIPRSFQYARVGEDDPVMRAARVSVVGPYYDSTEREKTTALEDIGGLMEGCPLDEDEVIEWAAGEDTKRMFQPSVECKGCGWEKAANDDLPDDVTALMECPKCGEDLSMEAAS